ncbi:MAG: hypothetical protein COW00_16230 [Bdellovibrio sp. CG12_big_fil_rev_8_21_14_0_65_39_13]|nr:MAG: hypothetical protein COW78_02610 [Bdellovibrio sp. CG22_combo_CG10-13_8_21_14_all_39_27]PIQ58389.1 MAG: hypothetical protein COW00_16230 [Bdellovibrio sp. CG12_big_fil_rev_8_21_14_0_65_39_13]PIR35902.1 MAG: hypothetical protein COV37_06815 [Bdellovibrio sp. CG11_big_fil_rev_8_21_14_0_20_39_38]
MRTHLFILFILLPHSLMASCLSETPPELRALLSDLYKDLRAKGLAPTELNQKMSKLTGMIIKESSANTCSVSDMNGSGSSTSYHSFFKHNHSKGIMSRSHKVDLALCGDLFAMKGVNITKQTNYGLAQISADRWVMNKRGGELLVNFKKELTRLTDKQLVERCHARTLFSDSMESLSNEASVWKKCNPGIGQQTEIKCLGKWLTLCPALNIEVALEQPLSYFETRSASSLCSDLYNKAEVEYLNQNLKDATNSDKQLAPPKLKCCDD